MSDIIDVNRFVEAQEGVYPVALRELQEGRKRSHWMWYIFPQLKHLGRSGNAKFFGISGLEEAEVYLQHRVLGQRLRKVSETILNLPGNDAIAIFGGTDARKLRSSMTLFDMVSADDIFARVIDKYFDGRRDKRTINIIMKEKFTPENIETLEQREIFVFGSNLSGYHVGGAAKVAVKKFGAVYGQAEGLQGRSYAIPTEVPSIEELRCHVNKFIDFARKKVDMIFLVTQLGCGEAGFKPYDVALLFLDAYEMDNVVLPELFVEIIKTHPRYLGIPMNSWNSRVDFLDKLSALDKTILPKKNKMSKIFADTFFNTVQIVNSGFYITENGREVHLPTSWRMERDTVFYTEKISVNNVPALSVQTKVSVVDRDCLKAAMDLKREGYNPAVLNMANLYNPGGGVLHGSRAQEESIFRRTNLFRSLYQFAPYASKFGVTKADRQYPLDINYGGIYSPDVIYFRDSEKQGCKLLETPQYVSVISVAAVDSPELDGYGEVDDETLEIIQNKIRTIFRLGLRHRHDSLVLGAWGCGAFRNPPQLIARLFHEIMHEKEFENKYRKVVFAIIEDQNSKSAHNPNGNRRPFIEEFTKEMHV